MDYNEIEEGFVFTVMKHKRTLIHEGMISSGRLIKVAMSPKKMNEMLESRNLISHYSSQAVPITPIENYETIKDLSLYEKYFDNLHYKIDLIPFKYLEIPENKSFKHLLEKGE